MISRSFTIACCIGLLAAAGVAAAPTTSTQAQRELRQLKARIEAIRKNLAAAEESKASASDALQASERAISDANRALAELSERARAVDSTLAGINAEMQRADGRVKAQQEDLARLLYQRHVAGRPETLAILLNGGDPNTTVRELHYLTYIVRAHSEIIARLRQDIGRLQDLATEARRYGSELVAVTLEQTQQRKRLEEEKHARAQVLARVSRDVQQQRRQIGTLKRDEARLTRLVDQLARLVTKPARPTARRNAEPRPEARIRNSRLPDPRIEGGPFAQLQGQLALPVKGELANRFGSPRQGGGAAWKGLFIAARPGEEVRAIAAGRVVFADWLRGFGNLLIIDHGDSYMSLYGYNETLFKQLGDVIRSGERVAAVGNSGGSPESGLYFEMRHEGRPFDPMTWVNVR